MSGMLITDSGEIVDSTPVKTERMRAIEVGQIPFGQTTPALHLCGSCRAVAVTKDTPICKACDSKLANREAMIADNPFLVRVVAIIGGFLIFAMVYWVLIPKK